MNRNSLNLHEDVITGRRKVFGWGLGGAMQYLLLQSPYKFDGIIDGLSSQVNVGSVSGIPIYGPDILCQYEPDDVLIVLFADPMKFKRQIVKQIRTYGSYPVVGPFVNYRDHPTLPKDALKRRETREDWRNRLMSLAGKLRGKMNSTPVKKRVALWNYALAKGGAERQMVLLALGFRALGWEVDFITIRDDSPKTENWADELKSAGVRRFLLPTQRDYMEKIAEDSEERRIAGLLGDYFVLPALHEMVATATILKARRPELLISYLDYSNIVAGFAGVVSGVPRVLMSGRSVEPNNFPNYSGFPVLKGELAFAYRSLLGAPGVFMNNNSLAGAESYSQWLGLRDNRISVVPNAVSPVTLDNAPCIRKQFGIEDAAPLIVGIMRLSEEKNPFAFIDIFTQVLSKYPEAKAILVGEGVLRKQLQKTIIDSGLGNSVILAGMQEMSYPFLAAADLLLVTSRMEGMPNVILEAQVMACPVVATDVGGVREAMSSALHGNIFPYGDWDALADCCISMLENPERARDLGDQARQEVLGNRSPVDLAKQTLAACAHEDEDEPLVPAEMVLDEQ